MKNKSELVLEAGKNYLTRAGKKARVVCDYFNGGEYTSIAVIESGGYDEVVTLTKNGRFIVGEERLQDIIEEYNFWNDVEVDTPIFVSHVNELSTLKRHFAKYENGNVFFYEGGKTSWSTSGILSFFDKTKDARLATKEDIEKSKMEV